MKILSAVFILSGTLLIAAPNVFAVVPVDYTEWLHVTALIDGVDYFEITGNTWRWHHTTFGIPETYPDTLIKVATTVNTESFVSTWPSGGGYGVDQFSNDNTVTGLLPIETAFGPNCEIFLEKVAGRENVSLYQIPTVSNSYTSIVKLEDFWSTGAGMYEFKIWAHNPVPEPATMALVGLGGIATALVKRRYRK